MKIFFKLLVVFIVFSVCSCEEEKIMDNNFVKKSNYHEAKSASDVTPLTRTEILEGRMQGAAYLTVQVVVRNREGRRQFINTLANSNTPNVIKLKELLNPNIHNLSFRNDFKREFAFYYNLAPQNTCNPGKPEGLPRPNFPVETIAQNNVEWNTNLGLENANRQEGISSYITTDRTHEAFEAYVSLLINDECLELYMPNGFDIMTVDHQMTRILSSAHPLDDSASNTAYVHSDSRCNVRESDVDSGYQDKIVIVRPLRNIRNNCEYNEYSTINFEDFLNNK